MTPCASRARGHANRADDDRAMQYAMQVRCEKRTCPAGVTEEAKREWETREPAWHLLHAVTLHEICRARCRTHQAYHATPRSDPNATSGKQILRKMLKVRLQQGHEVIAGHMAERRSDRQNPA